MDDRPTPEQIISLAIKKGGDSNGKHAWVLAELQRHGYVIVHPDDYSWRETWHDQSASNKGYNEALEDIFGEAKR